MIKFIKTAKNLSFVLVLSLTFFPSAYISGDNFDEQVPTSINLPDDTATKLQDITEKANLSIERIEEAVNNLNNRSEITTLLIGNNLGVIRFQLMQIRGDVVNLNTLTLVNQNDPINSKINNQISILQGEEEKTGNFILEQENKFSLFGWFVKIL